MAAKKRFPIYLDPSPTTSGKHFWKDTGGGYNYPNLKQLGHFGTVTMAVKTSSINYQSSDITTGTKILVSPVTRTGKNAVPSGISVRAGTGVFTVKITGTGGVEGAGGIDFNYIYFNNV